MKKKRKIKNWKWASRHMDLSEQEIRDHSEEVDWFWVSYKQKLSFKFILNNLDKVHFGMAVDNEKIPAEYFEYFEHLLGG